MGTRIRKYISSFLAFVMCGVIGSVLPVMAEQSDTCIVIRGNRLENYAQYNKERIHFPESLSKKITKSFAKKLKQARYHTEYEIAEIAFRLPDDSSRELELNVAPYSNNTLNPKAKQALMQAVQASVAVGSNGIQKGVCYGTFIEYSKSYPLRIPLTIIFLPILIPIYVLGVATL